MVHGAHYAARYGHVHILRWLSDLPADRCDWGVKVLDNAAGFDQWPAAQWLHTHRRDGCTTFAMNLAASCGNLQMVKWLHDNRTEGCTTNAMDGAAQMGYLDVVKWLHTNRTEGCTTEAMTYAAYNGHLDVVQWLHDNRSEGCSEDVYNFVAGGANSSLSLKGNDFERKLSCSVLLFGRTALKLQALDVLGLAAEFGQLVDCQVTEQRDGHRGEK